MINDGKTHVYAHRHKQPEYKTVRLLSLSPAHSSCSWPCKKKNCQSNQLSVRVFVIVIFSLEEHCLRGPPVGLMHTNTKYWKSKDAHFIWRGSTCDPEELPNALRCSRTHFKQQIPVPHSRCRGSSNTGPSVLKWRPAGALNQPGRNKSLIFIQLPPAPFLHMAGCKCRPPACHCVLILDPLFAVTKVQWKESLSH